MVAEERSAYQGNPLVLTSDLVLLLLSVAAALRQLRTLSDLELAGLQVLPDRGSQIVTDGKPVQAKHQSIDLIRRAHPVVLIERAAKVHDPAGTLEKRCTAEQESRLVAHRVASLRIRLAIESTVQRST